MLVMMIQDKLMVSSSCPLGPAKGVGGGGGGAGGPRSVVLNVQQVHSLLLGDQTSKKNAVRDHRSI